MRKNEKIKLNSKVRWEGYDAESTPGIWEGTVIGTGEDGVTVAFDRTFVGHSGLGFVGNNEQAKHSPWGNAWYFDYAPEHPDMPKVRDLILIEES